MKITAAIKALPFALCLTSPMAQAQQYTPGVDPNLVMALDQIISYVWQNCQMGNQGACQYAQQIQMDAQNLIGAGQYCYQTNDPNACQFYQNGIWEVEQAYGQMHQQMAGSQMPAGPSYDPNNPMGATHEERMANIAAFGAQNTQNWVDRGAASDANQAAFIDYIRQ